MSYSSSIAKAVVQCRHACYEFFHPSNCLHINGDLHLNPSRLDFSNHNLGDDLNLPLLAALTGKHIIPIRYSFHGKHVSHVLAIGSIIERLSSSHAIIWGSGLICPLTQRIVAPEKIYAVRGPRTREQLVSQGIFCPENYGDPACLLPLIYNPSVSRSIRLGIIPHVTDRESPWVKEYEAQGIPILDLQHYHDWRACIRKLCSCQCILSSSLHGLILADAYNIPSCRVVLSDHVIGGDFKYLDYYSAFRNQLPESMPLDTPLSQIPDMIMDSWEPLPSDLPRQLLKEAPFEVLPMYHE